MAYGMIPAGCVPQNRVAIYVTMKSRVVPGSAVTLTKTTSKSVLKFDCPDRVLHIATSDGGRPDKEAQCPLRTDSFDYAIFLDPYSRASVHRRWTKKVLVSALSGAKAEFFARDYVPKDVEVFADSGGAQLKLGTFQYVNPFLVIDWMNRMADEGASLDVAPRAYDAKHPEVIHRAARVQARNNQVFLRQRRDDLKLLNVVHGFTLPQLRDWLKIVYDNQFDGMASGCDSNDTAALCMRNILVPALETPDEDLRKRLHLFGTSGGATLPASVWLGKLLGDKTDFTTDSASWLYGCTQGMYFNFTDRGQLKHQNLWKSSTKIAPHTQMACPCEVCAAVRWSDVYRHASYGTGLAMSFHNLFVLKGYENFWTTLASQSASVNDYLEAIRGLEHRKTQEVVGAVKYVDFSVKNGLDEAERKFSTILNGGHGGRPAMDAMFSSDDDDSRKITSGSKIADAKTMRVAEIEKAESIASVLDNFDDAHLDKFLGLSQEAPPTATLYTGFHHVNKMIAEHRKKEAEAKKATGVDGEKPKKAAKSTAKAAAKVKSKAKKTTTTKEARGNAHA